MKSSNIKYIRKANKIIKLINNRIEELKKEKITCTMNRYNQINHNLHMYSMIKADIYLNA